MKIRNNRRAAHQLLFTTLFFGGFAALFVFLNALKSNPENDLGYYALLMTLTPAIFMIPYLLLTSKQIVLEDTGIAEYRKSKRTKLLKYEDVQDIKVNKSNIVIYGVLGKDIQAPSSTEFSTVFGIVFFKALFSKKYGNKLFENIIVFANYKTGFKEHELPFITEIAKRSNCEIRYIKSEY